jgi:proteasome accessory factor C
MSARKRSPARPRPVDESARNAVAVPKPAAKRSPPAARPAPRPPAAKDARDRLRRVLFLVPYAVKHPGIPLEELARRCGVSDAELLEDLDFLLGVGCPPFAPDDFLDIYVDEKGCVHVALHQSLTRPPRFTESEAAALAAAARALGGDGADRAVSALRESVPKDRRRSFDELATRIYAGSPPAPNSILGRLRRAIGERREVRLRYVNARDEDKVREVRPYTLAQRFGHWYLFGHDAARGKALPFRLDRIADVTVGETHFEPPTAAELARARLFSEATGEPIQIRLAPLAASWALARPGQLRVVERAEDGAVTVEVAGAGADWATRFALSLGGGAEVVAPGAARQHFQEAVRRALDRYR